VSKRKQEVADLLHSASIHVLRRARERDAETGLTPARLSALSVIVFRGPLTLGELAEAEAVRPATMTNLVNALERDGLARRRPHGTDGRSVLVESTAAGRRVLDRGRALRIDAVVERLDDLGGDDLELLWRAGQLLEERFAVRAWRPLRTP
jgi:DNA-binding MarR family transcriptional regulator